jgi:hypothetical protein
MYNFMRMLPKQSKMGWLDRIPFPPLVVVALLLALAPFTPEPHLLGKLRLLGQWDLSRPIDIFDLLLHATPLLLLSVKLGRHIICIENRKKSH